MHPRLWLDSAPGHQESMVFTGHMVYTLYRAHTLHFSDNTPITLGPKGFSMAFTFREFF